MSGKEPASSVPLLLASEVLNEFLEENKQPLHCLPSAGTWGKRAPHQPRQSSISPSHNGLMCCHLQSLSHVSCRETAQDDVSLKVSFNFSPLSPVLREVRGSAQPSSSLGAKESCSRLLELPLGILEGEFEFTEGALKSVSETTAILGLAEIHPGLIKLQSSFYYPDPMKHLQTSTDIVFTGPSYSHSSFFRLSQISRTG